MSITQQTLTLTIAHMRFVARQLHFDIKELRALQARGEKALAAYSPGGSFRARCSSVAEANRIVLRTSGQNTRRAYRLQLAEESLAYFLDQLNAKPCTCDTSYSEQLGQTKPHLSSCFARPFE